MKITTPAEETPLTPPAAFLRNKLYFLVTIAVLVTTVFSWFNLNSYCLILLGACALLDGNPLSNIRNAFTNKYFLAYFIFFLIDLSGQLHTQDLRYGWNMIAKDATLVSIAFVLCSRPFADRESYRKVMTAYCLILVIACCWCLLRATLRYRVSGDIDEFFYHPLVTPISQNAIFFTVFILFALLFLLFSNIPTGLPGLSRRTGRRVRLALILFFILMVILLASKLFLITLLVILIYFLFRKLSYRRNRKILLATGATILMLVILLMVTNNPIKKRYNDIIEANISMIQKEHFSPDVYFNGIQLRLLEWRFAYEILRDHHAWLLGVSSGDSQHLLDQKYIDANMYLGEKGRKGHGFIGYNFHNQYIETLVRSGVLGLAALLAIFGLLTGFVVRWRSAQAFFTVLILIIFFLPQSPLTMQHGIFLFCYFPLLLLYSPKNPE